MKNDRIVKSMKILVLWGCCSLLFGTAVMAQEAAPTAVGVAYRGHVQDYGDQPAGEAWVTGDAQLGTTGESKRIEGFRIKLTGTEKLPADAGIRYNVHVQNVGWLADNDLAQTGTWVADGDFAGSQSKSQRVEAIQIVLTDADGKALPGYSVQYQVHIQDYGWSQGWQADGVIAGTSGESKRLEAVQIKIVKTETDPAADESVVYDKAGTNGPATGTQTIAGDVTVAADGVMLQNLVIEGNLSISEAVGDGNVTLNNVTVAGDTFVRGGGVNSIHINGGSYKTISVENTPTGAVRIVAIGVNGLAVVIAEDASGETVILEGDFDSVAVNAPHLTVTTQGDTTTIGTMTVGTGAGGTTLNLASGTTVTDLVLAAKTSVTGPGTVKAAEVAADGVSFEKAPEQQTVAPEVTVPPVVTPVVIPVVPTPGGGGGYTPPSKIALTITDPTVTLSRVYDGTRNATVTATGALTGVVTGDDVRVTATAAYDSKAAGSDKRITVTYALVGTAASKYSAPVNKTMAGGTILPAPLTVSGTTITPTKEYDGTTAASCTLGTITGKITTDNLTVDAAAVYATRDIGTGKPVTLTYTLGGNDAGNYTAPAGDSNTTGEITCKTLTVLDNTQLIQFDKVYDGSTAIPGLAGELAATAINGVVPGDTVVVTPSGMFTDPNVGVHDINVSFTLSGTNADHYQINPKTITGKIVPTPLTAADTVVTTSKTYDGETTATITAPGSIGGIISADLSKVTVTPVASFDNKNAGSGKTITVTYTLEGDVAGNYSKPADAKLNTGVITAKPLTIEAPNLTTSKEYDSEVTALVSAGNLIGVIGTDAVTPKATASYNDKAAAENKTITVVYTLDGADKANYTAPADFTNTTGKITPKQLTNSLNTLTTEKVYNGTNSVDANGGDLVGVLEGDMVVRVIEAVYNTKDVGDTKTITISYPINGLDAANYLAPIPVVRTDGKITPKPLTVTGVEVTTTKAYNGDTIAAVTNNGTISGIFSDDYVVKVTPVAHYNDASAGENKTITVSFNKTGDDAGNYIVPAAYDYATNGIIN